MIDESKLKKLREIGMRFVETCATCEHGKQIPHDCDSETIRRWGSCSKHTYLGEHGTRLNMPAHSLMACNDHERRGSYVLRFVGVLVGTVPVASTPGMRWVNCPRCQWEGWDNAFVLHELNAGGTTTYSHHCPSCGCAVEAPRG